MSVNIWKGYDVASTISYKTVKMRFPEITENNENVTVLYFAVGNEKDADVMNELEDTYACFSKLTPVTRDGKKYIALEIADGE